MNQAPENPAQAATAAIKQEAKLPTGPFPGIANPMTGMPFPLSVAAQQQQPTQPPADIVTISDRKVRLPNAASNDPLPSMYSLSRSWVRNEPDLGTVGLPAGETLPDAAPVELETVDAGPVPIQPAFEGEDMDATKLLEHHKTHWKEVGKHMKDSKKPWDGSRLQALMPT